MKTIVVNNPAARSGGALTILKEFLDKVSTLKCNRKFFVIVSLEELKKYETDKIKVLVISAQGFKSRVLWDNFGLKKYLQERKIMPNLFISIQNTGVNLNKNIPQIIYYHQPLSIVNLKWNILKKNERLYWMYKNIYPIFIKQHLNKVKKVIVQTEWVRDGFSNKFKYPIKNIILIRPEIKKIDVDSIRIIPKNKFRIFYPAAPLIYKNHRVIIEALGLLKKENPELIEKIECIFTFSSGENSELDNLIRKLELESIIKLIGKISYEKVLEYYKSSDLLVFPSYLETFGLPLEEAQQFNLGILVGEFPYSREVCQKYEKVKFIDVNIPFEWKNEILKRKLESI
ncbi:MAG: glycosyltransferase [Cetobacterium sp.]